MNLQIPQDITLMHIILAYLGLAIHILSKLKMAYVKPDFNWSKFVKLNLITSIASALMIPVILILLCEPAIKTTLPLNNITAMLGGYQTNSIFKTLMSFYPKKNKSNNDAENIDLNKGDDSNSNNPDDIG
jgi:hypothetical protein